jgi:hypothetical protein
MPLTNVFDSFNQAIADFVNRPANIRLRPGTGSYSAPFRGSLFEMTKTEDVALELPMRRVDVLWLGSNPNVPGSLKNILDPTGGEGHFPDFQQQRNSGLFSARRWVGGVPSESWNPINKPRGGARWYRDLFADMFGTVDAVAMANFIPWGSENMKTLLIQLGAMDEALLKRALEFADVLNMEIVRALRPKLLWVPFPVGKNARLDRTYAVGVALAQAADVQCHCVAGVNFFTGICRRSELAVQTAYVPHPAGLRLTKDAGKRFVNEVPRLLARFQ